MKTQIKLNPDDRDFPIEDDSQEYSERWQYRLIPYHYNLDEPIFQTHDDKFIFNDDT